MKRILRKAARGYTFVELLMSLTVLAFGVSGIMAMERVTLANNRQAKNLALATRIAQAWIDQLVADGMLWTVDPSTNASTRDRTNWLKMANTSGTGTWFKPDYVATRGFGPAFGPLGQPRDPANHGEMAHFCAHLRLAFLKSETLPAGGNGVIRAQVRVVYKREDPGTATVPSANICDIDNATFDANLGAFQMVYLTTAIRQQSLGKTK